MLLSAVFLRGITYSLLCTDTVSRKKVEGMKIVINYRVTSVSVFKIASILVVCQSAESMLM